MIAVNEAESVARDPSQARLANRFSRRSGPQETPRVRILLLRLATDGIFRMLSVTLAEDMV